MLKLPKFRAVYLFQQPVSMRWGEKKLTQVCQQEMGIEPKVGDAFLFFNARRNEMKLLFRDEDGSNLFQKWMPRGGFMLPAPSEAERVTRLAPNILESLFRK